MSKKTKIILFSIIGLVAVVAAVLLLVANSKLNKIHYDVEAPEVSALPSDKETQEAKIDTEDGTANILLIGTDHKKEDEEYARSDSMILASLNFTDGSIKLASLERAIPVDGNLLNAYYHFNGPAKLQEKVSELFSVPLLGYAQVDGSAFATIVDAVGGIDVEMSLDEARALNGEIKSNSFMKHKAVSGMNHLDGYDAYQYCRQRYVDSDFGRMDRQKKAMAAIVAAVKGASVSELNAIADSVLPLVHTNLTKNQIAGFMLKAPKFLNANIKTISIPEGWDKTGHVSCDFEAETKRLHEFLGEESVGAVSASALEYVAQEDPEEQTPVENKKNTNEPEKTTIPSNVQIPVLVYYGAREDKDLGDANFRKHPVSQIKAELKYLKDNGYNPIWFEDLLESDNYEKPVIVVFEEGTDDMYSLVYPYVKELDFKISVAPVVNKIGQKGYLTAEQIKEMHKSGIVSIECMPQGDINLNHYDKGMIKELYSDAKDSISKITGTEPSVIAFPSYVTDIAKAQLSKFFDYGIGERGTAAFNTSSDTGIISPLYSQRGGSIEAFVKLLEASYKN